MHIGSEKATQKGKIPNPTAKPEARSATEITARMHFYAIRSAGDQLRWATVPETAKKPDRMVGR